MGTMVCGTILFMIFAATQPAEVAEVVPRYCFVLVGLIGGGLGAFGVLRGPFHVSSLIDPLNMTLRTLSARNGDSGAAARGEGEGGVVTVDTVDTVDSSGGGSRSGTVAEQCQQPLRGGKSVTWLAESGGLGQVAKMAWLTESGGLGDILVSDSSLQSDGSLGHRSDASSADASSAG